MLVSTVFEQHQSELEELLQNEDSSKDNENLQSDTFDFLSRLLRNSSAIQENLTTSEATILDSVKALLDSYNTLIFHTQQYLCKAEEPVLHSYDVNATYNSTGTNEAAKNIFASGIGAFFGKLIGGGWGAVAGSIAGSAVSQMNVKPKSENHCTVKVEQTIKVDSVLTVKLVADICTKIDELIETYRVQNNNIIERYSTQEKSSLGKDYKILLEGIQSLLGYNHLHGSKENCSSKLSVKVNNLESLLDNYDIFIADYNKETQKWFNVFPSSEVNENVQVLPAVIENNQVILKGKVYIPTIE